MVGRTFVRLTSVVGGAAYVNPAQVAYVCKTTDGSSTVVFATPLPLPPDFSQSRHCLEVMGSVAEVVSDLEGTGVREAIETVTRDARDRFGAVSE